MDGTETLNWNWDRQNATEWHVADTCHQDTECPMPTSLTNLIG